MSTEPGPAQKLHLINEELQHRVKNTLTVISAIASQTFKGSGDGVTLKTFQSRLQAFAAAHDSIAASHWSTATLRNVVESALAPHRAGVDRFTIDGSDITLGAKQAISMALALHELGTNATKYGALSDAHGRIGISWESDELEPAMFKFVWREQFGPIIVAPTRSGFGSRLIKQTLASDFGAAVIFDYDPSGFSCEMVGPFTRLNDPNSSSDRSRVTLGA